MKKIFSIIIALVLFAVGAKAQIVPGFTLLSGTNTYPVLLNFAAQSNTASMSFIPHSLQVTNITTNTAYTLRYGYAKLGDAASAMSVLGTIYTNLTAANGFTNGGTWTYIIPPQAYLPAIYPCASIGISNGTFVSGTITNGVAFQ